MEQVAAKEIKQKRSGGLKPDLMKALIYIILVVAGIILWSVITFVLFFALKNIQVSLYQKSGEALYIGGAIFIFLLMASLFVPISLYYLMSNYFFPNYWKRISKNDYIRPKEMRLIDKFCVVMAILSILGILLSFNRYIALGNDYVAFSQAGIIHERHYYSYNDVGIELEKNERTGVYEPRFYLKDKILSMGFWDDGRLVKNIQEHKNKLAFNTPYVKFESAVNSRNHSIASIISIILMGIGIGFFSRMFIKRNKK